MKSKDVVRLYVTILLAVIIGAMLISSLQTSLPTLESIVSALP